MTTEPNQHEQRAIDPDSGNTDVGSGAATLGRKVGLRRTAKVLTPMLILAGSFGAVSAAAAATDEDLVSNGGTSRATSEEREESHEWEVEFEMTAFSWEFFFGELAPPPDPGQTIVTPGRGG